MNTKETKCPFFELIKRCRENYEKSEYPDKYNPNLVSTKKDKYCSLDEIKKDECENIEIKVVNDKETLLQILTGGDRISDTLRLYRGQERASWVCRSSLMRYFKEEWEKLFPQDLVKNINEKVFEDVDQSKIWDEHTEFVRLKKKYCELLRLIFSNFHDNHQKYTLSTYETIFFDERIQHKIELEKFLKKICVLSDRLTNYIHKDKYYRNNMQALEVAAQHYQVRTSLLDFSKNPYIALYFAASPYLEGKERRSVCSKVSNVANIEDYMCLYFFDVEDKVKDWEAVRSNDLKRLCEQTKVSMFHESFVAASLRWDALDTTRELDEMEHLYYIDNTGNRCIRNKRIKRQEGVLFCLGCHDHCSLEEIFFHYSSATVPLLHKILIHTTLLNDIKGWLDERNINKKTLGLTD